MKNLIFIVSINRDNYLQYCLPSVELYCEKYNIDLKVVTTPKYNLPVTNEYNYNTFEKNQIYDFIDEYDRVLRLDSDVIVTPHCPNYFTTDPNYIYVSNEDVGSRKQQRTNEIKLIQQSLGKIKNWKNGYFNSGVILFSKQHKEIFNIKELDLTKNLGSFKEQNVLNWKVHNLNFPIKDLGRDFNHTRIYEESWCNSDRKKANIIHYAGSQNIKEMKMKEDFKYFFN